MKKIVLIQNDDGSLELDGNPVESPEDAIEQIKMSVMPEQGSEETKPESTGEAISEGETVTPENSQMEGETDPMESEEIGKTLGSKLHAVDAEKKGMRPNKKASFEDYGL